MTVPRRTARAVRAAVDRNTQTLADLIPGTVEFVDVAAVGPDVGTLDLPVVTVTWRGGTVAACGYGSTYTPAVGHRVAAVVTRDHQLFIHDRVGGAL